MISASSSPLVIVTPEPSSIQAVCEPSVPSMNAFRYPIAQEVVADPGVDAERLELGQPLVGHGLPDAKREAVALGDPLEDPRRAEPAVLVVDRDHAAARRDAQPLARRVDELVLGRHRDPSAELPCGLLAEDSRRLHRDSSRSTTPPSTSRSPSARASAAELSQAEW